MNPHRRITTLDNGFRIVTENMPGLKSASLGIWVNTGCRNEREEQNGIAHFLEHMAFKGTKTRSSLNIAEAIENVGGFINAYTSREVTAYYTRILAGDVALAQDVISDIVLNSVFDSKEIETERGVILQEIGQSHDTPDDVIFDWLQETAYPDQPMGRPILGSPDRVNAFSHDDFDEFIAQYYGPDQLVLAAAGAVNHDEIARRAAKVFSDIPAHKRPERQGAKFIGGEHREVKDLEQAHFTMSLQSVDYHSDDVYVAQLLSGILGGGMASRLFQEVREKRGLCYSIYSSASAFDDSGLFTIYAGTSEKDIGDLSKIVADEINRAGKDISEAELERSKRQMKAGMLMGLESASARCDRIARSVQMFGYIPKLDDVVAKIEAVDLKRVEAFVSQLCAGTPALALYGPVENAPDVVSLSERLAA